MKTTALPLLIVKEYLVDSPVPRNINYMWSFGSLLGLTLVVLIITGLSLAMHYTGHVDYAYSSIEHIMRDVNNGWLLRYTHANGVSLFFVFVYLHIGRGLYYGSYKAPRGWLWIIGVVIFLAMMATAFLGYVLPWGQMSFWGATVITNILGVLYKGLPNFIWGNFSVANSTLNRFFALHFLIPFILIGLVLLHLLFLHKDASNNPLGVTSTSDRLRFHSYLISKDLVGFMGLAICLGLFVFFLPNYLGHPDNYIPANPLVTPHSIVPEWYLLPYYSILRCIPNKTAGVIGMLGSICILLLLPLGPAGPRSSRYKPFTNILFFFFIFNFMFLTWLGAKPVSQPYIFLAQLSTAYYFLYILILLTL